MARTHVAVQFVGFSPYRRSSAYGSLGIDVVAGLTKARGGPGQHAVHGHHNRGLPAGTHQHPVPEQPALVAGYQQ
eukprot:2133185-Rhodomonas_salina.3